MAARILVIDDDPSALLLMRAALARAGFDVVTAADGEAGLRCFDGGVHGRHSTTKAGRRDELS